MPLVFCLEILPKLAISMGKMLLLSVFRSRFRGKKEGKSCRSAALRSKALAFVPLLGRKHVSLLLVFPLMLQPACWERVTPTRKMFDIAKHWWNNDSQCFLGFCKYSAFWKPAFLFVLVGFAQGICPGLGLWQIAAALRVLHGASDCPSL